jgi:hypothetical protein
VANDPISNSLFWVRPRPASSERLSLGHRLDRMRRGVFALELAPCPIAGNSLNGSSQHSALSASGVILPVHLPTYDNSCRHTFTLSRKETPFVQL